MNRQPNQDVLTRVAEDCDTTVDALWSTLFEKIAAYSSSRVKSYPNRQIDEQDIASSVFASLIRGCRAGRFEEVSDFEELTRLLQAMAKRKIVDRIRYLTRKKRSGITRQVECVDQLSTAELLHACEEDYRPEASAMLNEVIENAIRHLSERLRPIVGLRLQGYEHAEIAEMLQISTSTVARKLQLARETWKNQLASTTAQSSQLEISQPEPAAAFSK